MSGAQVKYLGGLPEGDARLGSIMFLLFAPEKFIINKPAAFSVSGVKAARVFPWDEVRIDIEDTGQTRANLDAIVAFGVFGLSSRKRVTLVSVAHPGGTAYFESEMPVQNWQGQLAQLLQSSSSVSEAVSVGPRAARSAPPEDPIDRIRRLGDLRDSGLISDAEFEAKKRDLLDRL